MKPSQEERQRAAFAGIVLLMRQLANQLTEHGNMEQARGIVDGLEAIQARTQGNLEEGEARFLEEVLFELRMEVVKGPGGAPAESSDKDSDDREPAP